MSLNDRLQDVNFSNADTVDLQSQLLSAAKNADKQPDWYWRGFNPLVDAFNVTELVEEPLINSKVCIESLASDLDAILPELSSLNNFMQSDFDTTDRHLAEVAEALNGVLLAKKQTTADSLWVHDSFNNKSKVGPTTTCFVDSDKGRLSLTPSTYKTVGNIDINVDSSTLNGIPGCNMLALDIKYTNQNTEPVPTLEKSGLTNLSNMTDGNNLTWFELERNFVPKTQPLRRIGRSWVTEPGAPTQDVNAATAGYDWDVEVAFSDSTDKKKEKYATFVSEVISSINSTYDTSCTLRISLAAPQALSYINIVPFLRSNYPNTILESLSVITSDREVPIASEVDLGNENLVSKSESKLYSRPTTDGSLFVVPTTDVVKEIVVKLRGVPAPVVTKLAHKYREEEIAQRTQRNYLFIPSVSHSTYWNRKPSQDTPSVASITRNSPSLLGNLQPAINTVQSLYQTLGVGSNILPNSNQIPVGVDLSKILGSKTSGQVLDFLGKANTYLVAAQVVSEVVSNAFAVETTKQLLTEKKGYDLFAGYRSYVAIRDISLLTTQYNQVGEFTSIKHVLSKPVTNLKLSAGVDVPGFWGAGDWVTFSISTDGLSWQNVVLDNTISLSSPTDSVFVRVKLKGNPTDASHSPFVTHYSVQGF
jgi:hypothetical protein